MTKMLSIKNPKPWTKKKSATFNISFKEQTYGTR